MELEMTPCIVCKKLIWPWQKIGPNPSWHKSCYDIWYEGYMTAFEFIDDELRVNGMPTVMELYQARCKRSQETGVPAWEPTKH